MIIRTPLLKIIGLTALALIAFAANSVLSRQALQTHSIDAGSFSGIRLLSGAIMLTILLRCTGRWPTRPNPKHWRAGGLLLLYAVTFSYAYISLDTATGAFILFGMVQITLIVASLWLGQKLQRSEWVGLILACNGLLYLMWPQLTQPSMRGFILMSIAGIAWGLYTLLGRRSQQPLLDTTLNFISTLPWLLLLFCFNPSRYQVTGYELLYAILSGAIASGVGYALWYAALPHLSTTQSALLQLLVPILAAAAGIVLLKEPIGPTLLIASLLIIGGLTCATLGRRARQSS